MTTDMNETLTLLPRTTAAADDLVALSSVDSTNVFARNMLKTPEPWQALLGRPGGVGVAVVAADEQTSGHGRLGRQWVSRHGESFTVSFISAVPAALASDASLNGWLPMIAGLAVVDALRGTLDDFGSVATNGECRLSLKWPNDIFCDGLKLGGILAELVLPPAAIAAESTAVVFGIGMNLRLRAERLPIPTSTSLHLHVAPLPPFEELRDAIASRIVVALRGRLRALAMSPRDYCAHLLEEVTRVCWTLGKRVQARTVDGGIVEGLAISLNADASLNVEDDRGVMHVVHTGDVGLLG